MTLLGTVSVMYLNLSTGRANYGVAGSSKDLPSPYSGQMIFCSVKNDGRKIGLVGSAGFVVNYA